VEALVLGVLKYFGPQVFVGFVIYILLAGRINVVRDAVEEIKAAIPECKKERRETEACLHDRVTEVSDRVARIEGWKNGRAV
jgi:hypothetical protein